MIDYREMTCELMPDQCKDEAYYYEEINDQLEKRFHIGFKLPIVFIDSWAEADDSKEDETQQLYFQNETQKLWKFAQNTDEFKFKTVDEVLEENQQMKEEIDWLNDIITKNITELQGELLLLEVSYFLRCL